MPPSLGYILVDSGRELYWAEGAESMQAAPNGEQKLSPVTFKLLSDVRGLEHGVFTRHGGVSRPPYASLNAAWNIGDASENVRDNLNRIKDAIGLDRLVAAPQVHGDAVHVVDEAALDGFEDHGPVLVAGPGDALVTASPGIGLMIKIADCQAVFLVDPVRKVVANVHSGWRGSVANILAATVGVMRSRFDCRPADILAAISPSLGPCCAEFKNYREELPSSFVAYQSKPQYFDFWAISRSQLVNAGLAPENIEAAGRCTVCEADRFFSYRAEKTTGRMAAVIGWRHTNGAREPEREEKA